MVTKRNHWLTEEGSQYCGPDAFIRQWEPRKDRQSVREKFGRLKPERGWPRWCRIKATQQVVRYAHRFVTLPEQLSSHAIGARAMRGRHNLWYAQL